MQTCFHSFPSKRNNPTIQPIDDHSNAKLSTQNLVLANTRPLRPFLHLIWQMNRWYMCQVSTHCLKNTSYSAAYLSFLNEPLSSASPFDWLAVCHFNFIPMLVAFYLRLYFCLALKFARYKSPYRLKRIEIPCQRSIWVWGRDASKKDKSIVSVSQNLLSLLTYLLPDVIIKRKVTQTLMNQCSLTYFGLIAMDSRVAFAL
uniref:Uncharacterized protein n=1 Tax=Glossina pallidipes TaxID=7398 RepID=A0A1B0A4B9_GLOPL